AFDLTPRFRNESPRRTCTVRRPAPLVLRGLDPAAEFLADHGLQHVHAAVAVVEAGDIGVLLAPRLLELLAAGDGKLLQRLDAVDREGRRDDGDLLLALFRQRLEHV